MKGERWLLVSPHLDQALELSGEERRRYLACLAGEDPALAADLELLLGEEPALSTTRSTWSTTRRICSPGLTSWNRSSAPIRW